MGYPEILSEGISSFYVTYNIWPPDGMPFYDIHTHLFNYGSKTELIKELCISPSGDDVFEMTWCVPISPNVVTQSLL